MPSAVFFCILDYFIHSVGNSSSVCVCVCNWSTHLSFISPVSHSSLKEEEGTSSSEGKQEVRKQEVRSQVSASDLLTFSSFNALLSRCTLQSKQQQQTTTCRGQTLFLFYRNYYLDERRASRSITQTQIINK